MFVKGYHTYKDIWTPEVGESPIAQIEPNNPVDKQAVCIRKFMRCLKKGASSRFARTIFFLLKGDPYSKVKTITFWCRCHLGGDEGLQVP